MQKYIYSPDTGYHYHALNIVSVLIGRLFCWQTLLLADSPADILSSCMISKLVLGLIAHNNSEEWVEVSGERDDVGL